MISGIKESEKVVSNMFALIQKPDQAVMLTY